MGEPVRVSGTKRSLSKVPKFHLMFIATLWRPLPMFYNAEGPNCERLLCAGSYGQERQYHQSNPSPGIHAATGR
jgi:hypothetical protein